MYDTNKRNIIQLSQQSCALGTDLIFFVHKRFPFCSPGCVYALTTGRSAEFVCADDKLLYYSYTTNKRTALGYAHWVGGGMECTVVGSVRPGAVTIVPPSATIEVSSVTTNSSLISRRLSGFSCLICWFKSKLSYVYCQYVHWYWFNIIDNNKNQ